MAKKRQPKDSGNAGQARTASARAAVGGGSTVVGGVGVGRGAIGQAGRFSAQNNASKYSLAGRTAAAGRNFVGANRTSREMLRVGAKTTSLPKAARGLAKITRLESLRQSSRRMFEGFKRESKLSSERFRTASQVSSELQRRKQSTASLAKLTERQMRDPKTDAVTAEAQAKAEAVAKIRSDREFARLFGDNKEQGSVAGGRGSRGSGGGSVGGFVSGILRRAAGLMRSGSGRGRAAVRRSPVRSVSQPVVNTKSSGPQIDTTGFALTESRELSGLEARQRMAQLLRAANVKSSGPQIDTTGFAVQERRALSDREARLLAEQLRQGPNVKSSGPEIDTTDFALTERRVLSDLEARLQAAALGIRPNTKSSGELIDTTGFGELSAGPLSDLEARLLAASLLRAPSSRSSGPEVDTSGYAQTVAGPAAVADVQRQPAYTGSASRAAVTSGRGSSSSAASRVQTFSKGSGVASWPSSARRRQRLDLGGASAILGNISLGGMAA